MSSELIDAAPCSSTTTTPSSSSSSSSSSSGPDLEPEMNTLVRSTGAVRQKLGGYEFFHKVLGSPRFILAPMVRPLPSFPISATRSCLWDVFLISRGTFRLTQVSCPIDCFASDTTRTQPGLPCSTGSCLSSLSFGHTQVRTGCA